MPGFFLTNAWMLAGLVALSVPVIIHLLLRRKKKRVRFSTIRFFLKQDEQASQRRRLRNWLLLAMRLLICALLIFAFARPYLMDGAAGAGQRRRQAVILLDRSLSLQAMANESKWIQARESAVQVLSELKPDDHAALISCGMQAEVLSEWAPPAAVRKMVSDLQPTCGAASLGEGLELATKLLAFANPEAEATIHVISDLQRSACQNLADYQVPPAVEVKLLNVGDIVTPNLAVTDLKLDADAASSYAVVSSFSDENAEVKMDVSVDGKVISSQPLSVSAGVSTNVDLVLPPLKPGWHDIAVQLRGQDALALDNARFQSVFVPEPARTLVVETRSGNRSYEEESFFVTTALDPGKDSTNAVETRFTVEKISVEDLAHRLLEKKGRSAGDLVVLPGLKNVPSTLAGALKGYLESGGGVLLFLGDGVSANRYNAEFRGLLPAQLGSIETSVDFQSAWRIGQYDTNTLLFGAFHLPNCGNLVLPRFTRRFALSEPQSVVASFQDGSPFVTAARVGRGRVVLVNTSADTSWNDWPKQKTYVPWLHGTGHYLAGLTRRSHIEGQASLVMGTEAEIALGPGAVKAEFKVQSSAGKELSRLTADDEGLLRDLTFPGPGVYSLRDDSGAEVRRLSVNVPAQESDLTALLPNEAYQQVARVPETGQRALAAGLFGSSSTQRELWRVLLLSALVLLFVEMIVANRTLA